MWLFCEESSSFSEKIFLLDNMVLDHIQVIVQNSEDSNWLFLQPSYEEALNNILMGSTEEEDTSGDSAVSPVQTSWKHLPTKIALSEQIFFPMDANNAEQS